MPRNLVSLSCGFCKTPFQKAKIKRPGLQLLYQFIRYVILERGMPSPQPIAFFTTAGYHHCTQGFGLNPCRQLLSPETNGLLITSSCLPRGIIQGDHVLRGVRSRFSHSLPDYSDGFMLIADDFLLLCQEHKFKVSCSHHGFYVEFETPILLATVIPVPIFQLHVHLHDKSKWQSANYS